jgi:hypothetical protein
MRHLCVAQFADALARPPAPAGEVKPPSTETGESKTSETS